MLPFTIQKLDLSRLSYSTFVRFFAPLLPATVLLVGALLAQGTTLSRFVESTAVGNGVKLAAIIAIAYVSGWFLIELVGTGSIVVGFVIGWVVGMAQRETVYRVKPSRQTEWRKLAKRVIPFETPDVDSLYFPENYETAIAKASAIRDQDQREEEIKSVEDYYSPLRSADLTWSWWYQVMKERFGKPIPEVQVGVELLRAMQGTAIAIVVVLTFGPVGHWFLWAISVGAVMWSTLYLVLIGGFYDPDPNGYQLTAAMLRYLDKREEPPDRQRKGLK